MRVRLLGGFLVEGFAERDLGSRKARTLLKLLAVRRGSPVAVDAIVDVLWSDDELPARPAEQVGVLVSRLRAVLGSDRIIRTDAGYALQLDWVDVDEVAALTDAAVDALDAGRAGAARAAARAALELTADGSLLGSDEGEWLDAPRARARATVTRARRVAVDAAAAVGDLDGVVALAEDVLAADPYDEVVLRGLMQAHLDARRPASALAVYARQRARLAEDLGVPPTAETEALHATALAAADGDLAVPSPSPPAGATGDDGPDACLVGRSTQLGDLDAELAAVRHGTPRLVVVTGDAGMGKTALVEAWAARLGSDALVLRGRCDELGRDLPLQPITDALVDHLRVIGPATASDVLADDAAVLAPILGPVVPGPAGGSASVATSVSDPEHGRLLMFTALLGTITRAAGERVAVVVVEDLQLAAASTVAWLAFAQRRGVRLLLLATTRDRRAAGLRPNASITVGPLSRADLSELVGDEAADEVLEHTGGHPILVSASTGAAGDQPAALADVVGAQLDALDDDTRRTLVCAAAAGSECDVDLIAMVRSRSNVEVVRQLEEAARTGLVVERDPGFAFRHELLRDAVNATSTSAQVAALHGAIATAMAQRPRSDPLSVAVHARAGGLQELAAASFIAAAEAAAARFDLETAEAHLAAAIDAEPDGADGFIARARVRMSASAFEDAARDAAAAAERNGGGAALEVAGWVAYYRRRYDEALAFGEAAIAQVDAESPLRVSAAALVGRIRHGIGDLRGALHLLESPGEAPVAVRGIADVWLAQARLHQGRPTDALAALARPSVAPDSLAHPWAPLHLRFNRVLALGQLGRVAEAAATVADLDAVVGREGPVATRFVAPSNNVASWVLRWSGRGDEADERNRAAIAASGDEHGPSAEGFAEGYWVAHLDLTEGRFLAGDLDGAARLVDRMSVMDSWNGTMAWHQRHRLDLFRSRLALADGDRARAAALAWRVANDAAARGAGRYELLALAVAGLADEDGLGVARLAPVVEGLGRCAVLDGWWIVSELARARHVDQWRLEAHKRAAAVVEAVGDDRATTARFVDRMLGT